MSKFKFFVIRVGICLLILLVYGIIWRPARTAFTEFIIYPQLASSGEQPNFYSVQENGVALSITFNWKGKYQNIQYRPQSGLIFLIALLTLCFISFQIKWFRRLFVLHISLTLLTAVLVLVGQSGWVLGFILVDAVRMYLVPVLTFGIVGWAFVLLNK